LEAAERKRYAGDAKIKIKGAKNQMQILNNSFNVIFKKNKKTKKRKKRKLV
jgi:hypothetical protein